MAKLGGAAAAAAAVGVCATDTQDRRRMWALCEAAGRAATLVGVVGYVNTWSRRQQPPTLASTLLVLNEGCPVFNSANKR